MYTAIFLLFTTSLLSGFLPYWLSDNSKESHYISLPLAFSGSYLLSITFTHLLPDLFKEGHHGIGHYLLAGFVVQLFLDALSHGFSHGHSHLPQTDTTKGASTIVPLLLALYLHALLDGLGLGGIIHGCHHDNGLVGSVLLHKMPVAFALGSWLIHTKQSLPTVFVCLVLFSCATPAGWMLVHYFQESDVVTESVIDYITAFAMGSLLHIAMTIVTEAHPANSLDKGRLLASLFGILLALLAS